VPVIDAMRRLDKWLSISLNYRRWQQVQAEVVRRHELTPFDLVDTAARIERVNPTLKAAIMALYEDSFPTHEFDEQSIRLLRSFLLRPMADRRKK
jgi:hypothetical protein